MRRPTTGAFRSSRPWRRADEAEPRTDAGISGPASSHRCSGKSDSAVSCTGSAKRAGAYGGSRTMHVSSSEVEAVVVKAVMGVGLAPGLGEDAGRAAKLMLRSSLGTLADLADALDAVDGGTSVGFDLGLVADGVLAVRGGSAGGRGEPDDEGSGGASAGSGGASAGAGGASAGAGRTSAESGEDRDLAPGDDSADERADPRRKGGGLDSADPAARRDTMDDRRDEGHSGRALQLSALRAGPTACDLLVAAARGAPGSPRAVTLVAVDHPTVVLHQILDASHDIDTAVLVEWSTGGDGHGGGGRGGGGHGGGGSVGDGPGEDGHGGSARVEVVCRAGVARLRHGDSTDALTVGAPVGVQIPPRSDLGQDDETIRRGAPGGAPGGIPGRAPGRASGDRRVGAGFGSGTGGVSGAGPAHMSIRPTQLDPGQAVDPIGDDGQGADIDAAVWRRLRAYAERRLVEGDERSRLTGAGAGVTDTD